MTSVNENANTNAHANERALALSEAKSSFDLSPKSLEEAMQFAELLSKSNLVPKEFQHNAGNILVAVQWGMELGLKPMQAMQNIAVINGRPSLWGDAVIALVRASPLCEYVYESMDETGTAICRVKRRGEQEQVRTFSDEDARQAGLLNKAGTWTNYPARMKQMRARAFALRDVFPDVLKGMPMAEEVRDLPLESDGAPAALSPLSPAQIAQRARAASPPTEKQRQLIAELEQCARTGGLKALRRAWEKLPKAERALSGEDLARLKVMAEAADKVSATAAAENPEAAADPAPAQQNENGHV